MSETPESMTLEQVQEAANKMTRTQMAGIIFRLRKTLSAYRKELDAETGKVIGQFVATVGLTDEQRGRLQVLTHQANDRVKDAIKEIDARSPSLHPLDR